MISATVIAYAQYSASVEEHATVFYYLAYHERREFPRKTQNPEVDRQSSASPAQPA